ncbi:hypothetical protein SEVIR_1G374300v4 [Setaria viridis]|nr:uncharacterized protein LOC101781797 [Setaria italica]XP_034577896.1 uncharacterized protein LOC117841582 [Setaria viridis]RCV08949.1 hypothetical protein SETIT_1G367700v2 [Setaria italica]TKW42289.1 hypothetical protein SEVIR_1G374300v2 [Setaria viridis]
MGKKSGRNGGDKEAAAKATAFVLKVPMHCRCDGCADKIRAGVKDLTLNHGIEALDQSALWTKGELRVASTADPEKLRRRLHKATGKSVGLVILKPQAADKAAEKEATAAALEELLRRSLQQQGQYGHGHGQAAWANQVLPGAYGYGAPAPAYHPWAVQVQQPEAYPSYQSAYPAASTGGAWGAYAYPTAPAAAQLGHGAYGGGWPY